MLIGLVSDIHSNLVALEAVLEQLPLYDHLWCLGDTIGYGPRPNQCLDYMRGAGEPGPDWELTTWPVWASCRRPTSMTRRVSPTTGTAHNCSRCRVPSCRRVHRR